MLIGEDQIFEMFERFEQNLDSNREAFPNEIKANIVQDIVRQDSIDTRAFVLAVNYHEIVAPGGYAFSVDTSDNPEVGYEGFLEFPNVHRRDPEGRYHFRHGIENSDFGRIADEIVVESFF